MNNNFCFEKEKRLLKRQSFSLVIQQKQQKIFYKNFLIFAKTNNLENSRLGIIIAKKNVRKAVDRNFLKRKIRESFRNNQFNLNNNLDIVFMLTKKIKQEDLNKYLEKIHFDKIWNLLK